MFKDFILNRVIDELNEYSIIIQIQPSPTFIIWVTKCNHEGQLHT